MKNRIVFYSGGIMSWATAKRAIEESGEEDRIILFFTDTLIEDPDLYRFLAETTAAWDDEAEFIRVADGRTPFEIFRDVKLLGNSRLDPCSRILKRELSHKYVKDFDPEDTILYIGYNWDEPHRLEATQRAYSPFEVRAPLMEPPYLAHADVVEMLEDIGIAQPRLYERGYCSQQLRRCVCKGRAGGLGASAQGQPRSLREVGRARD